MFYRVFLGALCGLHLVAGVAAGQSLAQSGTAMREQNAMARQHGFEFLRTPADVGRAVSKGQLVHVLGNADYEVKPGMPFPFARPAVRAFLEELGEGYKRACGERLVATSLTRPTTRQPRRSSRLSVHPTGSAMDLRRSWSRKCRNWLEARLLLLEADGVLDAAYESRPPHYHVALYPSRYREVETRVGSDLDDLKNTLHVVKKGESLWKIARRYGASPDFLKAFNDLPSNLIQPDQVLKVPVLAPGVSE